MINDNKKYVDLLEYDNEVREYVINKRSKKIHSKTCASVDKMSEKNKDIKKDTAYYPCEYLKDSKDSYKKAGDDCVRFVLSCMNTMNNNFTKCLSKSSMTKWSHVNSLMFANSKKMFAYAMRTLGFEIFDIKRINIDIDNDNISDGKISVISSDFKLKKGDILATKGHVHIYLDDNYGIDMKNFGWGKVNYIFPQSSKCSLEYTEDNGYQINCNGMSFTRVYRYKGKEKGDE